MCRIRQTARPAQDHVLTSLPHARDTGDPYIRKSPTRRASPARPIQARLCFSRSCDRPTIRAAGGDGPIGFVIVGFAWRRRWVGTRQLDVLHVDQSLLAGVASRPAALAGLLVRREVERDEE